MRRMVSAREIVGRTIVAFRPNASPDGQKTLSGQCSVVHYPEIELDDGSVLYFVTEELESASDYGVFIGRQKRRR